MAAAHPNGALRIADSTGRRLAWAAFLGIVLANGLALTIAAASDWKVDFFALLLAAFPAVGILILIRQPKNTIGWILLSIGGIAAAGGLLSNYASYGLRAHPGSLPGADVALALSQPLWAPIIGIIGTYLLLLFPDGRLPSRHARGVVWSSTVGIVGTWVLLIVFPTTYADSGYPGVTNPLGIEALRPFEWVVLLFIVLIPISIVASAASVILRFRHSRGAARLQLKWLTAAAALTALLYALAFVVPGDNVFQNLGVLSFLLIPIAIGLAILRYRLYDIDVVINKTLVYGSLTAVLAGVYVGLAVGLGSLVGRDNSFVIAGSTLVVATLFRPVRGGVQEVIDRRFYRRKYDVQQTLEAFTARLREEVNLDELRADLLQVVDETVRPAHLSLWLLRRGPQRLNGHSAQPGLGDDIG